MKKEDEREMKIRDVGVVQLDLPEGDILSPVEWMEKGK